MPPASAWHWRSCRRKPIRSTSLAACRPFSVCRGGRQRNFFSQSLGQLRATDADALAGLDFGAEPGNCPVVPVSHRFFEQGRDHPQGRFTLHRGRAGRDARLQRINPASAEIAAPQPNRVLTNAERFSDPRAGPARQRQQHSACPVRFPAITRPRKGRQGNPLLVARCNRRLSTHATPTRIGANSESQKPARWSTNQAAPALLSIAAGAATTANPHYARGIRSGTGARHGYIIIV